ncbi:PtxR [Aeromonas veronii]|nr:PtxR [Aeromonas veronii]
MLMSKDPLELLASDPVELTILTLKTRLMMIVTKLIQDAGYNQVEAASVLKVTQPRVSNLMNGKISKFSIDMLIEMLGRLGYLMDVSFDLSSKENPISVIVKKSAV